jgi:hypothetical protein
MSLVTEDYLIQPIMPKNLLGLWRERETERSTGTRSPSFMFPISTVDCNYFGLQMIDLSRFFPNKKWAEAWQYYKSRYTVHGSI